MTICPNCSCPVAEDQEFCGKCGHRVRDTVAALSDRLTKVESRSNTKEQKYLELEVVENIMNGVQKRATRFLYFAGFPAAIAALALAWIFGKGAFDLHSIAANAKQSVDAVLDEAKSVAAGALSTAKDARNTSQQVNDDIKSAQKRVAELKSLVDNRVAEAQKLDVRIKESEAAVAALAARVNSQTQQVAQLAQQVKTAESQKNVASIKNTYPAAYGEHVASWRDGFIDPTRKAAGEVYIDLVLNQRSIPAQLDAVKVGTVMQSFQDHHYKVLFGGVWLVASTGSTSQGLGAGFDELSCGLQGVAMQSPCIFYFSEMMTATASQLRTLVSAAQEIPADRVRYVPLTSLTALHQELVQRSGLDFVVVLGGR